ncbi:MAG: sporulation protein YabP [Clostridia bacterium]|nr:sporulation protein YabP [Clostridia bacterium]
MSESTKQLHNVIMEGRKKLNMSGVLEVVGFDDETVTLETNMGLLTIKGERLKIGSFSASSSDIDIEGNIIAMVYTGDNSEKGGFFRKLLK